MLDFFTKSCFVFAKFNFPKVLNFREVWGCSKLKFAPKTKIYPSPTFDTTPAKKHFGGAAPFAFTKQGVAMLSTVLRSNKAIDINIAIMRTFVALRHFAFTNADLSVKVGELEKDLADVNEVLHWLGQENQTWADEIASLQTTPKDWETRRPIGFQKE